MSRFLSRRQYLRKANKKQMKSKQRLNKETNIKPTLPKLQLSSLFLLPTQQLVQPGSYSLKNHVYRLTPSKCTRHHFQMPLRVAQNFCGRHLRPLDLQYLRTACLLCRQWNYIGTPQLFRTLTLAYTDSEVQEVKSWSDFLDLESAR